MLDNVITLAVDVANDGNTVNQEYRRYMEQANKTTYIGANNSLVARDQIAVYRTEPKVNGNFRGVAKSATKITEDVTVLGVDQAASFVAPMIIDISCALPVGTTPAKALEIRQRAVSWLDSAIAARLHEQLEI